MTGVFNLYDLQARCGGSSYNCGTRWVGPGPGHSRKDRSLSVRITPDGRVLVHSFAGDDFYRCLNYLGLAPEHARRLSPQDERAEREALEREFAAERARKLEFCRHVWEEAEPALGSPVQAYLAHRGLDGAVPPHLKFHPFVLHGYEARSGGPAMVGLISDPTTSDPLGLHVTFLREDGRAKAALENPRRIFGSPRGGVVQLSARPPEGVLAVAEGIETALSFAQLYGVAAWSCMNARGLASFNPPQSVQSLLIGADNDMAGREAARKLADRLRFRCATATYLPPNEGDDWNDFLMTDMKETASNAE